MKVSIKTILPLNVDVLTEEVRRPEFFRHMAEPWLGLVPVSPPFWPDTWMTTPYQFKVNLFGRLQLGNQEFVFTEPAMPAGRWAFRCKSKGAWVALWDHWIILKDAGDGQTLYRDKITVRTGLLRPVFQFFARRYTQYHQDRLKDLVASGFIYPAYAAEKLGSHRKHAGRSRSGRRSAVEADLQLPQAE